MIIQFNASKDPDYRIDSFDHYHKVESDNMIDHFGEIQRIIMLDKPPDKNTVVFYSMPDQRGMRFLRVKYGEGEPYIMSDFRYEWIK